MQDRRAFKTLLRVIALVIALFIIKYLGYGHF